MSETAEAQAGDSGLEVSPEDVAPKESKSAESKPKTESKEKSSQPKSEAKSSDEKSEPKQEAKEDGTAPWAKDLADRGLNDPNFDSYLREVWQPRMTQFEQDLGNWSNLFGGDMERAQIMAGLADALEQDPEGTYQQIGELLGLLSESEENPALEDDEGYDEEEYDDEEPDEYRQWVMSKMQEEEEAHQDAAYEELLTELETAHPGFDRELFHAAIVAFEGDPDQALEWYMKYHKPAQEPSEMDGPDPVGEGNPVPPTQETYSGIGDAIAAFMSEDKTARS